LGFRESARNTTIFALSFSPSVEIHLLRPGIESATMTMARLLPPAGEIPMIWTL